MIEDVACDKVGTEGGQAGTPQGRCVDEIRKGVMFLLQALTTGLDDLHI